MSLGIKSIWRTGSQRIASPGVFPTRICELRPSRLLLASSFSTGRRLYQPEKETENNRDIPALVSKDVSSAAAAERPVQVRGEVMESNHARNAFLRGAFRDQSPVIQAAVDKKRNSPYVPTARDYPLPSAMKASKHLSQKIARVQVGFDLIWKHFGGRVPEWSETFSLLKQMTPKRSETPNMAAVRVVLPSSWDMSVGNKRIEFVDATTGLATKLRVSADHQNPSAIVLRGENAVLAKAADELIRACPDVEIFKLGDVATFDYNAKRLWPAIENAQDGGLSIPPGNKDNVWMHREMDTFWVDRPYEQTPKPTWWTKESFEAYIMALVCGRLRPHLAMKYYKQPRENGKLIDTDGIRIKLIINAFEDPSAREYITPSVLKMAIAFMSQKGGHRASAERLFTLAEEWGLPMDTEIFNVILGGYVAKRDVAFFHKFLQKMETRYFYPNARTWLHFLTLVQRDDERRQVIAAMYEIGLFDDPATRRGIAEVMASNDSYAAFKAGKPLDVFLADQAMRYGEDWFTAGALHSILKEFFWFHEPSHPDFSSFKTLLLHQPSDGRKMGVVTTANHILECCIDRKDWPTALWALSHISNHAREPNHRTYTLLTALAIHSKAPSSLGLIFFYATLDRKLRRTPRKSMQLVMLRRLLSNFPVRIFSKVMGRRLKACNASKEHSVVAGAEWAILQACDGYKPVKSLGAALEITWRTMDQPLQRISQSPHPEESRQQLLSHDYAVKLRDPSGQRPPMTVHLDAAFDPETMLRDWVPQIKKHTDLDTNPENTAHKDEHEESVA